MKVRLDTLPGIVRTVLARLPDKKNRAVIVGLIGELGAGKTTFVQALAKELEIAETVQSPTYVLMKRYEVSNQKFKYLVHIDAYRLSGPEEFKALKPETFLNDPRALVVVEWPERIMGALPPPDMTIRFSSEDASPEERYIEVV